MFLIPHSLLVRPHPENPREPQLVLLDHGLYKELDREFRVDYANLWKAIILGNSKDIELYCRKVRIGHKPPPILNLILKQKTSVPFSTTAGCGRSLSTSRCDADHKVDKIDRAL